MVDMYRALFLCLLNLAVHGSLDLLIFGTEEAQQFVTGAFQAARIEIQAAVSEINSGLTSSVSVLDEIPGYDSFGMLCDLSIQKLTNLNQSKLGFISPLPLSQCQLSLH